jgi:uncharacterized protein DUF3617
MKAWCRWLAVAVAVPGCALAQLKLEEGNWHITTRSTTNGKPDPVQEQDECLRDELKDLASYFAPALEGVEAKCDKKPQKAPDGSIVYRMRCVGKGFTTEASSEVRIVGPKHFMALLRMDTRTSKERAVVEARAEGRHTGPCKPG